MNVVFYTNRHYNHVVIASVAKQSNSRLAVSIRLPDNLFYFYDDDINIYNQNSGLNINEKKNVHLFNLTDFSPVSFFIFMMIILIFITEDRV